MIVLCSANICDICVIALVKQMLYTFVLFSVNIVIFNFHVFAERERRRLGELVWYLILLLTLITLKQSQLQCQIVIML